MAYYGYMRIFIEGIEQVVFGSCEKDKEGAINFNYQYFS